MNYSDIILKISYDMPNDPLEDYITAFEFSLNAFGKQMNNPQGSSCEDRIIGDFELIYIVDGESVININNKEYICKKGDLVLIPPFVKNKITANKDNPHCNYWIHFDVNPFYKHNDFIRALVGEEDYVLYIGISDELLTLYKTMEKELESKNVGYKVITRAILSQILAMVIRIKSVDTTIDVARPKYISEKIVVDISIRFFRDNIDKTFKLVEISRHIKVSEAYLYKCFSKVLKSSPAYVMNLMKIKYAEQLLKTTDLTLKEIAEAIGFSSPFYLSTVFKKFYALSPREYMRKCK